MELANANQSQNSHLTTVCHNLLPT